MRGEAGARAIMVRASEFEAAKELLMSRVDPDELDAAFDEAGD
jgi:hypothetical protein